MKNKIGGMRLVTIREVAKEADVSIGTVSRYLNGHQLKQKNQTNIKKAIKKLGYKENIIAKGLKNNRSLSIGVLVNSFTDIFAMSIVSYLENYLEKYNYSFLLCDYQNNNKRLKEKLAFLENRFVDGMVIFPLDKNLDCLKQSIAKHIAIVAVDAPIKTIKTDTVLVDNYDASYEVVEKLFKFGHKKIGIIAGKTDRFIGRKRLAGYIDSMKNKNIYNEKLIAVGNYTKESGYIKTKQLIERNQLTALYSTNYYMTIGAIQALIEENYSIPKDISLIGFDHFGLSNIMQSKLTAVEQPIEEIGLTIGKLILKQINHSTLDQPLTIELKTKLVWRDSVRELKKDLAN